MVWARPPFDKIVQNHFAHTPWSAKGTLLSKAPFRPLPTRPETSQTTSVQTFQPPPPAPLPLGRRMLEQRRDIPPPPMGRAKTLCHWSWIELLWPRKANSLALVATRSPPNSGQRSCSGRIHKCPRDQYSSKNATASLPQVSGTEVSLSRSALPTSVPGVLAVSPGPWGLAGANRLPLAPPPGSRWADVDIGVSSKGIPGAPLRRYHFSMRMRCFIRIPGGGW